MTAKDPYYKLCSLHAASFVLKATDLSDLTREAYSNAEEWLGSTGIVFPSSEHARQALKAKDRDTMNMFAEGGVFSTIHGEFFSKFMKTLDPTKVEKKVKYWSRKNHVGILAKMAASQPKKFELLGLEGKLDVDKKLTKEQDEAVWKDIIRQKHSQNPILKDILLATGDKYLVDFSVSAKRNATREKNPYHELYTGLIDADGNLYGQNLLGMTLAGVRSELM
jgi:predicted NAD-dependent protein-ADP-ribosyltransferase YbiA (DUF1768 family)